MSKTGQKNSKKTTPRGKQPAQPAPEERGIWREAIGVILFFAGLLLLYFLFSNPTTGAGQAIVRTARALAGNLCWALPLLLGWAGVLVAFSGKARSMKPSRVILIALLFLLVMTVVHVFSADRIMEGARLFNYETFLQRSWQYQEGGAGLLGALLCWPLQRNLGLAGALMVLIGLILADLILLRKISLRRIGQKAQARYDDFREVHQQRATQRMLLREQRQAEAAQAETVIPKVALRQNEADDPFAKYLGENAAAIRRGRGQRIEKISQDDPLPGEPKVTPVMPEEPADDIPDFLSGRKKKRVKAEKLNIREPRPLRESLESAAPIPDGSEVAEQPRPLKGQAQVVLPQDPWQEVDLVSQSDFSQDGSGASGEGFPPSDDASLEDAALEAFMQDEPAPQGPVAVDGIPTEEAQPPQSPVEQPLEIDGVLEEETPPFPIPGAPIAKPASRRGSMPPIAKPAPPEEQPYIYPPIDLLEATKPSKARNQNELDVEKGKKLIETLASFGISVRMIGIAHGPTVTRFELSPAAGVKVSRITALSDDIALNLAAVSVRIEAPIPGKAAVGVEVPNDHIETVPLRDVLESGECRRHPSRLAVALGRDNAGRYVIADLAKMPHVLIAGQTGSGKSVCINCIICSILYRATPEEVRLIMIDPKVVELSCYNGIPHLLVPVVTDPKKAASALEWAVNEMTQRYKKFAQLGVRDMKGYNQHRPDDEPPMPQIVIIIDELADLMMVTPGEVEDAICRLAQLARAAGIHLVIATQRPSVNVITGVIKANIPSRIAFTVASQVDSRTILDVSGAEKLLGRGDMLYAPSGMGKTRVQGAWVSDDEVHQVVEYLKVRHDTSYDQDAQEHIESAQMSDADREDALNEFDELLPEAVEMVIDAGAASVSMLQRRLRVGHSRAGRLIDEMEVRGIVGPDEGSKSRKVLITREQYRNMFGD